MRTSTSLLAWVFIAGCGGAGASPAAPAQSAACRAAVATAADAWAATEARAQAEARPSPETEPAPGERALDRLEEHARALSEQPREVDGDEAYALSSAMMDAIDAAGSELPVALRERADLAAEALLTDRGRDGAARAARDAVEVLEQVMQASRPGTLEQRARRRALEALARRAADAAGAYRDGDVVRADVRADRAEVAELPADVADVVRDARAAAAEASTAARRECGIERRLSVPTL